MEKTEQKWLKEIRDNTKQLERIAKRLDAIYRQMDRLGCKNEPQAKCDTCRFEDYSSSEEPCYSCLVDGSKWQPKRRAMGGKE